MFKLNGNLDKFEFLWIDNRGIESGTGIDFDFKGYKTIAISCGNGGNNLAFIRLYANQQLGLSCGTPAIVYDQQSNAHYGNIFLYFDKYSARLYFHTIVFIDFDDNLFPMQVYSIIGISKF